MKGKKRLWVYADDWALCRKFAKEEGISIEDFLRKLLTLHQKGVSHLIGKGDNHPMQKRSPKRN